MSSGLDARQDEGSGESALARALALLDDAIDAVAAVDVAACTSDELLAGVEAVEGAARRVDAVQVRMADALDETGAGALDGHRSAKSALQARGRVSSRCAAGRVRTARALRQLPQTRRSHASGDLPVESVQAIGRFLANPRVRPFGPVVDETLAEQARIQTVESFQRWLLDLEALLDADGAAQDAAATHERRRASIAHNPFDESWTLQARFGALQGSAVAEMLARQEQLEFEKDWAEAKAIHGEDTCMADLARTPAQRAADAVFALFLKGSSAPLGSKTPEPVVSVIIDQQTFEDELRRLAGAEVPTRAWSDVERYRCQTADGTRLAPEDALAAALVGHVRRVVVDAASNVIDLGRRRRLFVDSSREAVMLQAVLRDRGGLRCSWTGCDVRIRLQADHGDGWKRGGRTDVRNGRPHCGFHNRLRERGYDCVEESPGLWRIRRPD